MEGTSVLYRLDHYQCFPILPPVGGDEVSGLQSNQSWTDEGL